MKMKRLMGLVLAILMVMPCLFACKKEEEPTGDDSSAPPTTGDSVANEIEYDENGYQKDRLGKQDFGGKEIRILAYEGGIYEEFDMEFDDIEKNILGQAVYNRNAKVQARMNVKLTFTRVSGYNATYAKEYIPKVEAMVTDNALDAVACYSMAGTPLMVRGYLSDLTAQSSLDFEAPWWSQKLIERASLYDRLYFATGSISPSLLGQTWAVFFNKKMADTYLTDALSSFGVNSLYEMVDKENNLWTLDNFITLAKNVKMSGTTKTADDTYGLVLSDVAYDPFYFASGLVTLDNAADGSLQISEDWGSAKTVDLLDKLLSFFKSDSVAAEVDYDGTVIRYTGAWNQGNSLFTVQALNLLYNYKENNPVGEDGIGVLPVPKWNEDQEEYYTMPGFVFTLWGIIRNSDRTSETAATMECLASEGYRITEPYLYDQILKTRATDGEGSANDRAMIDIIRDSIVVDAGRLHNNDIYHYGWGMFRNSLMKDLLGGAANSTYASYYANATAKLQGALDKINSSVYAIESVYGNG